MSGKLCNKQPIGKQPMNNIPSKGDQIRLVAMADDPDPIRAGQTGTVIGVSRHGSGRDTWHQIDVAWDDGWLSAVSFGDGGFAHVESQASLASIRIRPVAGKAFL